MNIRDLKYILKVAETASFAKAAKECFVSQPALSIQIKKVEEELGIQIFERKNKKFLITEAGTELIEKAKLIIKTSDEITQLASAHKNPLAGNITIGAFPTLAPFYFPKILPLIAKKLPELKLFLVEEKTASLLQKLENGQLDAAFIALDSNIHGFESQFIFDDEFLIAVPEKHKLAGKARVSRADFAKETLLLLQDGHCLSSQAMEFCELLSNYKLHDFRATSLETLLGMVAQNLGVTLVPKLAATKRDGIKYAEFADPPKRQIGLFWRKNSARKPAIKAILEILNSPPKTLLPRLRGF